MPPGILAAGLEQSDLLLVRAPNPVILLTEEEDFFDQRGSLEAFERIRHVYRLLGAEEAAAYYVGPREHGYWQGAREAMCSFFNRQTGVEAPRPEGTLALEPPEVLQCTETGQVSDLPGAKCVPAFTAARSRALAAQRGEPAGAALAKRVAALLRLPERHGPPDYRVLRPWTDRGYARPHANQCVLETDPPYGAQVVVTKLEDRRRTSRPLCGGPAALLYVPHLSSDQELREDARLRELETTNPACFACDYRGIGESRPDTCRPEAFFNIYGSDYHYAGYATMLGESTMAWRVHDLLSTLDWMASFGYDQVHLVARGWGAVPGALTALLDDRIRQVTLMDAPSAYAARAEAGMQDWPFSAMLPSVLEEFDLPDIYRELVRKKACALHLVPPSQDSILHPDDAPVEPLDILELRQAVLDELARRRLGESFSYAGDRGGGETLYGLTGAVYCLASLGEPLGSRAERAAAAERILTYRRADGTFAGGDGPGHALHMVTGALTLLGEPLPADLAPLAPLDADALPDWLDRLDWRSTHKELLGSTLPLLAGHRVSHAWRHVFFSDLAARLDPAQPLATWCAPQDPPKRVISALYHLLATFAAGGAPYPAPDRLLSRLRGLGWEAVDDSVDRTVCTDGDWAWLLLRLCEQRPAAFPEAMAAIRRVSARRVRQWPKEREEILASSTHHIYCYLWVTGVFQAGVRDHYRGGPIRDTLNEWPLYRW